jgi:surface polysaccharide O-acyltransferase-like enzyme
MEVDARTASRLMMEILVFTLNAIFVYLFSDWIIRTIEEKRGEVLKHRPVIFFVVFLILVLVSFQVLRIIFAAG